MNPNTGLMSPQHHIVFDNRFSTVKHLRAGSIPDNWKELNEENSMHDHHKEVNEDPNDTFFQHSEESI